MEDCHWNIAVMCEFHCFRFFAAQTSEIYALIFCSKHLHIKIYANIKERKNQKCKEHLILFETV